MGVRATPTVRRRPTVASHTVHTRAVEVQHSDPLLLLVDGWRPCGSSMHIASGSTSGSWPSPMPWPRRCSTACLSSSPGISRTSRSPGLLLGDLVLPPRRHSVALYAARGVAGWSSLPPPRCLHQYPYLCPLPLNTTAPGYLQEVPGQAGPFPPVRGHIHRRGQGGVRSYAQGPELGGADPQILLAAGPGVPGGKCRTVARVPVETAIGPKRTPCLCVCGGGEGGGERDMEAGPATLSSMQAASFAGGHEGGELRLGRGIRERGSRLHMHAAESSYPGRKMCKPLTRPPAAASAPPQRMADASLLLVLTTPPKAAHERGVGS